MRLGQHMTDGQRAQESASHMGNTNALGHHVSEEAKATISLALKGKSTYVRSLATRERNSAASMGNTNSLGRHWTEEEKAKMSAAHKGIPLSDAFRAASLKARLGHSLSEEHKAKISASEWKGGRTVWIRKQKAKRRALGFVSLNDPFGGSEGHHVDNEQVIYMPKALHRSVYHRQADGRGMAEINAIAYNFLFKQEVETALAAGAVGGQI